MPVPTRQPHTLLITLDAFGTLYRPRHPIAIQYLDLARSCGLAISPSPATTEAFTQSFKKAFKSNYSKSPNYGKARTTTDKTMTPENWWSDVVHDTFTPLLKPGERIPESLPESLFNHFASEKGYELFPDTAPFFQQVKQWKMSFNPRLHLNPSLNSPPSPENDSSPKKSNIIVAVLTNSDPRVSSVLRSLGLSVRDAKSPRRKRDAVNIDTDIDFVLTSWETGCEKPSPLAFMAAEAEQRTMAGPHEEETILKVHIGDDLRKDYWGAINAGMGWNAVLLDRDSSADKDSLPHRDGDSSSDGTGREEHPFQDVKRIEKLTDAKGVLMDLLQ